ncbi:MAG TPA: DivIVA domain-containing protein [Candidatus Hydrogenedentes bacterium]|nr:DivIVA domain-containing protein [Candidatus Hydrogenedentota bacterium]HNT89463.1 DivIVA domain-containing protein [Candidatus Hydrogenedentota bacterium]
MRRDRVVSEVLGEEAAITPSDLYNMQFKTAAFGGYDKAEVDGFLERVADVFEDLVHQVAHLKQKCEEQRADIETFRDLEVTLKAALDSIQNYKQEIVDSARREANAIIEEARAVKAKAEAEARKMPDGIEREARALRDLRDSLRNNLRAILEAHAILLDKIPLADDRRFTPHAHEAPPAPPTEEAAS